MCRIRRFLAVLRSFFHSSLLCTFSCHPSAPTILPSSLTPSCHLFLGLPLNLVVPKFSGMLLGSKNIAPLFFHLDTRWQKRSASHPEHFTGWERPPVPRYLEGFKWKTASPTTLKKTLSYSKTLISTSLSRPKTL